MGAHTALALLQKALQTGHGGIFHQGGHIGRAEHRQGTGTHVSGGKGVRNSLLQAAFCSNQNHERIPPW